MFLVRLPNHIGDACMALPAVRLLADSGCDPVLVGRLWAHELFAGEGWRIEEITGRLSRDIRSVRTLVKELGPSPRGLLLPNSFSSALLFRIAGVRSAGLATDGRRLLLTAPIEEPPRMHEVKRFWSAAQGALTAWGIQPASTEVPSEIALKLAGHHADSAARLIADYRLPARFALIAPVATGLHRGRIKHWPHFGSLIEPLRQRGVEPVAMPSAAEAAATRATLPGVTILPPASLGTYAALAVRSAVVVANDSGISHVAAAVGALQVTVFGVTDMERTRPWSPRARVVGSGDGWPEVDPVLDAIDEALADAAVDV